jgi:hypothetical protein
MQFSNWFYLSWTVYFTIVMHFFHLILFCFFTSLVHLNSWVTMKDSQSTNATKVFSSSVQTCPKNNQPRKPLYIK